MNFVYFGSFRMSADILERLVAAGFAPSVVICSPDRPTGRKQIITASAIKQLILEKKWPIKIFQPEKLPSSSLEIEKFKLELGDIDVAIVMGYPQIIKKEILALPRLGTIGIHPSLLPLYRGASPIQSALLNDEKETGVTLYQMDEKMDHGAILASRQIAVANEDTNTTLEKKLGEAAAKLLVETVPNIIAGTIASREQNHALATFTRKFTTADAQVDMVKDAPREIYNKIRAFTPEPGVWTMNYPKYEGKRVKLLEAEMTSAILRIVKIQVEGKKPVTL